MSERLLRWIRPILLCVFAFAGHGAEIDSELKERFFAAIGRGDLATMKAMIGKAPGLVDVREKEGDSAIPLGHAIHMDEIEALEFLLEAGADPDAYGYAGGTPLGLAALKGKAEFAEKLLEYGAAVDKANRQGGNPLGNAARNGQLEVVRLLLDNGARLGPDENGFSPMFYAHSRRHEAVIELLAERGAEIGPAELVVKGDEAALERLTALLKRNRRSLRVRIGDQDLLDLALNYERTGSVRVLLEAGFEPTAEHVARCRRNISESERRMATLELLAANGADVLADADGKPLIWEALAEGTQMNALELVKLGMDPDAVHRKHGPLIVHAIRNHKYCVVLALVQSGAKIDLKGESGAVIEGFLNPDREVSKGYKCEDEARSAVRATMVAQRILPSIRKGRGEARLAAIRELAEIEARPHSTWEALVAALGDRDDAVVDAATDLLVEIAAGDPERFAESLELARSPEAAVRSCGLRLLAVWPDRLDETWSAFEAALGDRADIGVVHATLALATRLRGPALGEVLPTVLELGRHRDPVIAIACAEALPAIYSQADDRQRTEIRALAETLAEDRRAKVARAGPAALEGLANVAATAGKQVVADLLASQWTRVEADDLNRTGFKKEGEVLHIKCYPGQHEKAAAKAAREVAVGRGAVIRIRCRAPADARLDLALAIKTGEDWVYHESIGKQMPEGEMGTLIFDLTASSFKSAASGWEPDGVLANPEEIKEIQLVFFNGDREFVVQVAELTLLQEGDAP